MKILVLSALYPPETCSGIEFGYQQVVAGLCDRGHDVLVLTTAPRTPTLIRSGVTQSLKLADLSQQNQYVLGRSFDVSNRLLEAEATGVCAYNVHILASVLAEFAPDVVYVGTILGVGGLSLMATLQHLGVPWVWHLTDDAPVQLCRHRGEVIEPLLREVDRQLDGHFLVASEPLAAAIEAAGISLGPAVEIIPPWVRGPDPAPRLAFYRPGDTLRVVAVGSVGEAHGTDLLIEAVATLRDRGFENLSLDLYGDVDSSSCPVLARRLGVRDRVRFWESQRPAALARIWSLYDLAVFPLGEREPFACLPLEASRRGCVPVVVPPGGHADWAVHGVHCLKVDRSPAAFAASFEAVLDGTVDLEPLARRAAGMVGRDFHLDKLMPKIEQCLTEAASRRRPSTTVGTAAEAYRMALLAEKLTVVLVQEAAACA